MNNSQYLNLQNSIENLYFSTNDNIVGVGYSYKITNGIPTDLLSIQFSVNEKKSISDLSPEEIIPTTINIDGIEYVTDVVEQQLNLIANACYSWDPPDSEILEHRSLLSTLKGGTSISKASISSGTGTLGLICVDNIDNTIIGLTNNHVIINNAFLNSSRIQYDPNSGPSNCKYIDSDTSDIIQPGMLELAASEKIGPTKRYYPLTKDGPNYIDAAIIAITNSNKINSLSYQQINNPTNYVPQFATTSEINSLLSMNPKPKLYKSGRTTGFIGGTNCPLEIMSVMQTTSVGLFSPYSATIPFSDCITYKFTELDTNNRPKGGASIPGDSGSVVLAEIGGVQKVIGLNFAGGTISNGDPQGNLGLACRIDRVANMLNIRPFGGPISFTNPLDWTYHQDNETSSANSVTLNIANKTYWQIGTI